MSLIFGKLRSSSQICGRKWDAKGRLVTRERAKASQPSVGRASLIYNPWICEVGAKKRQVGWWRNILLLDPADQIQAHTNCVWWLTKQNRWMEESLTDYYLFLVLVEVVVCWLKVGSKLSEFNINTNGILMARLWPILIIRSLASTLLCSTTFTCLLCFNSLHLAPNV